MVLKDKKEERRILIRKIVIIAFLVMVVIGFTVPSFLNSGNNKPSYVPPRMCQADADCYLECDGQPVAALCSQNLCAQNSCEEKAFYPYNATSIAFTLGVKINGKTLNLANRSNANDFFVKFSGAAESGTNKAEPVAVYTSKLALKEILEKAKVQMSGLCLITNQSYCTNEKEQLQMLVNGNASYSFGEYVPQEGDKVEVVYS